MIWIFEGVFHFISMQLHSLYATYPSKQVLQELIPLTVEYLMNKNIEHQSVDNKCNLISLQFILGVCYIPQFCFKKQISQVY